MDFSRLSYWEKDTFFSGIDIAIVGGGIVGLSAGIFARRKFAGAKVVVLERAALPHGATTRNAGFACFGSVSEILDDLDNHLVEDVMGLVSLRWKGLMILRQMLGDENIGYEATGGYEIFTPEDSVLRDKCLGAVEYLNQLLIEQDVFTDPVFRISSAFDIEKTGFSGVTDMIYNPLEGQLHSGKLWLSLYREAVKAGVIYLTGMDIESIRHTGNGVGLLAHGGYEIPAERVIVANNGFARKLLGMLDVQPARGQVIVTSPLGQLPFAGPFHHHQGYNYFRNLGDRVLLGGGRHIAKDTETTDQTVVTEEIQQYLETLLSQVILPGVSYGIEHRWAGIMGMGKEKKPVIRQVEDRVYCAVRMGGMGVAIGTWVAQEVVNIME